MKRGGFKRLTFSEVLERSQKKKSGRAKPLRPKGSQKASRSPRQRVNDKAELAFKRIVREKYNFTCQFPGCGYYDKYIDVQHINKRSQRPDLKYDPNNGITLCRFHHDLVDNTVEGRKMGIQLGLAKVESYERANKESKIRGLSESSENLP